MSHLPNPHLEHMRRMARETRIVERNTVTNDLDKDLKDALLELAANVSRLQLELIEIKKQVASTKVDILRELASEFMAASNDLKRA